MKLSELGDPKYISLEICRKNEEAIRTPVWTVAQNGKLFVGTFGDSWKVKRARNNPRIRVAKCDMRGNTRGPWVEGVVASISDDPERRRAMGRALCRKYHCRAAIASLLAYLLRQTTGQVVVEIVDA